MNETRRFLRNVVPGLIFLGVVCLLTYLSHPCRFASITERQFALGDGAVVVLGAGIIGYLLAIIHHLLYHSLYRAFRCLHVDIRGSIKKSLKGKRCETDLGLKLDEIGKLDAWCITEVLWHPICGQEINEKAYRRSAGLWDLMHASGTIAIGCVAALLFWVYLLKRELGDAQGSVKESLGVGCALCLITYINHFVVVKVVSKVTKLQVKQMAQNLERQGGLVGQSPCG